jgi:tripartite-type tricarboxylate transporter receptor subunit TctC
MNRIKYLSMLLLAVVLAAPAFGQAYPSKPIRWVVGYSAGGGSDLIARTVGQALQVQLGQPVIIDNRPGGGRQSRS